jgi:hypothetical protein
MFVTLDDSLQSMERELKNFNQGVDSLQRLKEEAVDAEIAAARAEETVPLPVSTYFLELF